MDYHADRFDDHSIIFSNGDKIVALLPASKHDAELRSHGGLTYGGLILGRKTTIKDVRDCFDALLEYASSAGFKKILYKPVPHIYHSLPSEEDLYSLFLHHASLLARNVACAIYMPDKIKFRNIRRAGIRKAEKLGLFVKESDDFETFWAILEDNLSSRFNTHPVHSLDEILQLKKFFPDNIRLFTSVRENKILGGTVLYLNPPFVAHTQYISASPEGKESGALDLLFSHLIDDICNNYNYFDFGTSNADNGYTLNQSLVYQKEGFGARAICYDSYEIIIP